MGEGSSREGDVSIQPIIEGSEKKFIGKSPYKTESEGFDENKFWARQARVLNTHGAEKAHEMLEHLAKLKDEEVKNSPNFENESFEKHAKVLSPSQIEYARQLRQQVLQEEIARRRGPIPPNVLERADYISGEPTDEDDRRSEREFKVRELIRKANTMLRGLRKKAQTNQPAELPRPRNAIERADYINGAPTDKDNR